VAALYPFDRRWYYGDAVFIFEPWLWLLLGLAAAWNARSLLARTALSSVIVLLAMALAYAGAIPGRASRREGRARGRVRPAPGTLSVLPACDIRDLRFETAARGNFTALRLRPASEAAQCPPHMTSWARPRADLLEPSP
jgi:hypothetical protein